MLFYPPNYPPMIEMQALQSTKTSGAKKYILQVATDGITLGYAVPLIIYLRNESSHHMGMRECEKANLRVRRIISIDTTNGKLKLN